MAVLHTCHKTNICAMCLRRLTEQANVEEDTVALKEVLIRFTFGPCPISTLCKICNMQNVEVPI